MDIRRNSSDRNILRRNRRKCHDRVTARREWHTPAALPGRIAGLCGHVFCADLRPIGSKAGRVPCSIDWPVYAGR